MPGGARESWEGGGVGRGAGTPLESSVTASPIFINDSHPHPLHTTKHYYPKP